MTSELLDILAARSGLVCVVGAGGKKTTLYRLAAEHPGRVGITATVHITRYPRRLGAYEVIEEESEALAAVRAAAAEHRVVAFAGPSRKRGRYSGYDPALVARIHAAAGFDVTLVKADGARMRWIKAPNPDEPRIPQEATTVIPVVSARALGEPLTDRIAHRVERVCAAANALPGERLTPQHLGHLLASERGALQGVGAAEVVPLINMVDAPELEAPAREAAVHALALSDRFERVVLASMRKSAPLVAVVGR